MPTLTESLLHEPTTRGELHGRPVVLDFGDSKAEDAALREAVGLVDLSDSTQVEITGGDRRAVLHRLSTNNIDGLRPGEGRETFITDGKGHVVGHVLALAEANGLVLRSDSGQGPRIVAQLDYYIIHDDAQVHDRSDAWAELLLAGPRAGALLEETLGIAPPQERLAHLLVPLAARARPAAGRVAVCLFSPIGPVFLVSCPAEEAAAIWRRLCGAGARPCGRMAWEALRIELGWPTFGVDVTRDNLPQEVGRNAQAIAFNKGCYLGQETVARIDARGHVNRLLVGLRLSSAAVPPPGSQLQHDGQSVGQITSAAFSPGLGRAIALGYVRRGHHEPGSVLQCASDTAEVVPLPLVGPTCNPSA